MHGACSCHLGSARSRLTAALIDNHYNYGNEKHSCYTDTYCVPGGRTTVIPVFDGVTATETTVLSITVNIAVFRCHRTWTKTSVPILVVDLFYDELTQFS